MDSCRTNRAILTTCDHLRLIIPPLNTPQRNMVRRLAKDGWRR